MWWLTGIAVVFLIGVILLFRWLGKWRDPDWDGEAGRAKSFLWSIKGSGGGGIP